MEGSTRMGNQNLVSPVKVSASEPFGLKARFYKIVATRALSVLSAFAVGYSYYRCLFLGLSYWFVLAAVLVFCIVSALDVFMENRTGDRAVVIVLEVVALIIPFYVFDWHALAVLAAALFVLLFWGYAESRSELGYATRIRFFRITAGVLGKAVTSILIFGILAFFLARGAGGNVFVGQDTFDGFFTWATGLAKSMYPTLSLNGSFNDFAQSVAQGQLESNPTFNEQDPASQAKLVQQGADQLTESISSSLGISIASTTTMSGVAYGFIVNTLHGWQASSPTWFSAGWGVAVFLILRSIGVLFVWALQFLSMLVYEFLLSIGFIRIAEHPETQEVIEY